MYSNARETIERALTAMAVIRVALGITSRASPGLALTMFDARDKRSPELDYVIRVFGARAFALGVGYLRAGAEKRRMRRLGLACDISDVVTSIADLYRGDMIRGTALRSAVLTGSFAAVGLAAERFEPR